MDQITNLQRQVNAQAVTIVQQEKVITDQRAEIGQLSHELERKNEHIERLLKNAETMRSQIQQLFGLLNKANEQKLDFVQQTTNLKEQVVHKNEKLQRAGLLVNELKHQKEQLRRALETTTLHAEKQTRLLLEVMQAAEQAEQHYEKAYREVSLELEKAQLVIRQQQEKIGKLETEVLTLKKENTKLTQQLNQNNNSVVLTPGPANDQTVYMTFQQKLAQFEDRASSSGCRNYFKISDTGGLDETWVFFRPLLTEGGGYCGLHAIRNYLAQLGWDSKICGSIDALRKHMYSVAIAEPARFPMTADIKYWLTHPLDRSGFCATNECFRFASAVLRIGIVILTKKVFGHAQRTFDEEKEYNVTITCGLASYDNWCVIEHSGSSDDGHYSNVQTCLRG